MKATAIRAPENTRRKILEAAFDEFYRNGFQGSSLNRIVEEAGTTKGALFHHFEGKSDLGYAVVRELIHPRLKTRWSDPLAQTTDPITEVKRLFRLCSKDDNADGQLVNGCPLNNLAQEMAPIDRGFRKRIQGTLNLWIGGLEVHLKRGQQTGVVRRDVDTGQAAHFIVMVIEGMYGLIKGLDDPEAFNTLLTPVKDYLRSIATLSTRK